MTASTASILYHPGSDRTPSALERGLSLLSYPIKPRVPRQFHNPDFHSIYRDVLATVIEQPEASELWEEMLAFHPQTAEHSARVMTQGVDFLLRFGGHKLYGVEGVFDFAQGALFHDTGKMDMAGGSWKAARAILDQPGPLSKEQEDIIYAHPHHSRNRIAQFNLRASELAYVHHEGSKMNPYPFDGNSYLYDTHVVREHFSEGRDITVAGKQRPVDTRVFLPGVEYMKPFLWAADMRDGACSFLDDRPSRAYQKNDAEELRKKANSLIHMFAGPKEIMEYAVQTMLTEEAISA